MSKILEKSVDEWINEFLILSHIIKAKNFFGITKTKKPLMTP